MSLLRVAGARPVSKAMDWVGQVPRELNVEADSLAMPRSDRCTLCCSFPWWTVEGGGQAAALAEDGISTHAHLEAVFPQAPQRGRGERRVRGNKDGEGEEEIVVVVAAGGSSRVGLIGDDGQRRHQQRG